MRIEDLTRKNHELEWTTISLCRRTHSMADRIGSREDRRYLPYLRARGYGGVLRKQDRRRGSGGGTVDSNIELSDYQSDA